jgi:hypothetical protein
MDPLALLKAVRQYADRICLFCQAGKIHVPRSYQPLLTNLEDSIIGVSPPNGGSLHAKLWFLRYLGVAGTVTYRLLCLSRNMTFDRCWDTMLSLEGELRDRTLAYARNHALGEVVEALPAMAVQKLTTTWKQRLDQLAHEIRRVDFQVPAPFEDMVFRSFGTSGSPVWPFPSRIDKALVVSPFVDDGFLEDLAEHEAPMQLVSRPESLAALQPESLEHFEKVWILDDTTEPEASEVEESEAAEDSDRSANERDVETNVSGIPLIGLHAKLYVVDSGWDSHVWTGSANATDAGFGRNVEMLVQLTGKRSKCGVDVILGRAEGSGKHAACLADLLRPYEPHEAADTDALARREFERKVQKLACDLAAAEAGAHCSPSLNPKLFRLALRPAKSKPVHVPDGWQLRTWPISMHEVVAQPVHTTGQVWVQFDKVSFEGLTSFFAFDIVVPSDGYQQRFVLNFPLIGAPENRREQVLRMLLSDRDRVLRFLLLLLLDHDASDFSTLFSPPKGEKDPQSFIHSMFESTLFESLVRALDREPTRIDQVEEVVRDLSQTDEGKALLPKCFDELWRPIWEVRQRQRVAGK